MGGECSQTGNGERTEKNAFWAKPDANAVLSRLQMQQAPAVGHTNSLGAAENVEFSEERLDVALDGDFGDGEICPDKFVGLAGREQLQNIQLASSQLLSGQSFRKLRRDGGW